MELKRRFDFRKFFAGALWLILMGYTVIGLQSTGAAKYTKDNTLSIPSIGLVSDVTTLEAKNGKLDTPDTIVGSFSQYENKTLLIGHSTSVFDHLHEVKLKDIVTYGGKDYKIVKIELTPKSKISMAKVIAGGEQDTLIIMTCAGTLLPGGDATHRLMLTAKAL